MTPNNNLSPLPFYTDIELQQHRRSYAYGEVFPLYADTDKLLPFQIYIGEIANLIDIEIIGDNGTKNIYRQMTDAGLKVVNITQNERQASYVVFPALYPMALSLSEGRYYIKVSAVDIITGKTTYYYSDIITLVNNTDGYIKIMWYDNEDLYFDAGAILYEDYKPYIYICSEIGKPDYVFEEEATERDGYTFIEKQISEKTYKFTMLANEPLCDVMRFIRMADNVIIRDKYGRVYEADTFLITPKWQTQGDIASVECEFQTDTVVKKINKGYTIAKKGDFNNDFSNSFDKL